MSFRMYLYPKRLIYQNDGNYNVFYRICQANIYPNVIILLSLLMIAEFV